MTTGVKIAIDIEHSTVKWAQWRLAISRLAADLAGRGRACSVRAHPVLRKMARSHRRYPRRPCYRNLRKRVVRRFADRQDHDVRRDAGRPSSAPAPSASMHDGTTKQTPRPHDGTRSAVVARGSPPDWNDQATERSRFIRPVCDVRLPTWRWLERFECRFGTAEEWWAELAPAVSLFEKVARTQGSIASPRTVGGNDTWREMRQRQ